MLQNRSAVEMESRLSIGGATFLPEGIRKIGLFLANQGAASCRIQAYAFSWIDVAFERVAR